MLLRKCYRDKTKAEEKAGLSGIETDRPAEKGRCGLALTKIVACHRLIVTDFSFPDESRNRDFPDFF
jgi:hypothetical protein